jgi:hypothetical protein
MIEGSVPAFVQIDLSLTFVDRFGIMRIFSGI